MNSRRLVLATGLAIGVYGMEATVLGTILPELSRTFTPGQSGTIASVQSLGLIVASLAAGPVVDRAGPRVGIMAGLTLIGGALSFLPAAHTYVPVLIALLLVGVGGGVISTSTNTMASELGGDNPARMLNLLNVFFGLGGLATPALGAAMGTASLCRGIVCLAGVVFALFAFTQAPRTKGGQGFANPSEARGLLRPIYMLLCLFLFLYVASEVGVWNWLAAYLTGRGLPEKQALNILSFGFAAGIITGRLAASRLLVKFRSANVTLICAFLMAITTSALLLTTSAVGAGIAVFCAGLTMAPVYPTTLGIVGEAFPRGTATAIGIIVTMGWVGVAVSSKIIGGIAGNDPAGLGRALVVIPVFSVLMVFVNLAFRPLIPRISKT